MRCVEIQTVPVALFTLPVSLVNVIQSVSRSLPLSWNSSATLHKSHVNATLMIIFAAYVVALLNGSSQIPTYSDTIRS